MEKTQQQKVYEQEPCDFTNVCYELKMSEFCSDSYLKCSFRRKMMSNGIGTLISPDDWLNQVKEKVWVRKGIVNLN